ncbi:sensor histidine kinase [Pseudolysinimonas sp.]|uniref:sensor histidine kinase n=1 Tax=Pseudolysinimonas sp. TaxID=2680009 RepID=UPI003F808436
MNGWLRENSALLVPALAVVVGGLLLAALVLLVLWLVTRRRYRRALRERVEADRDRLDFELLAAEQTSRLRIIRELHELIVPSLTAIVAQADGARFAATADPAVAARTAAGIAESARTTLGDLRRVVDVARDGEEEAGPQPGLDSLGDLFAVMRDAGLGIRVEESGERLSLTPGAELAVYRILQEALANALAHGGAGTEAKVTLRWTDRGLEVLVDDDGARRDAASDGRGYGQDDDLAALTGEPVGRGITEMRERTEIYGGVFRAYAVPGIGFSVSAVFPALAHHNGVHGVPL